jgi:hypothetical protein
MYVTGSSIPFDCAKKPCGKCTVSSANIITRMISAGPTGPSNDSTVLGELEIYGLLPN